jgi:hypothetical protein
MWITSNYVNGVSLFSLSNLIKLKAYLSSQRTPNVQINYFVYHWSIYLCYIGVGNPIRSKCYIFLNVCSTWSMVQLKTRFESWITRKDAYGISLMHLYYLITLMAHLCSQRTPNFQVKCFMFALTIYRLFVLNRGWELHSLQIIIFVYICSTWSIVELKTRLVTWLTRYDVIGVRLLNLSYLI